MTEESLRHIRAWFAEYCSSFYSEHEADNYHFQLKEKHTHNVCANIIRIAADEGLDEDRLLLAETAALLHDVGRFEQYHQFRTFRDSISVDHAALGADIIREIDLLAELLPHERDVVSHAVENHNAFTIPKDLSGDSLYFLQLLRDADKLDIWRVFIENYEQPVNKKSTIVELGFPDQPYCTPDVLEMVARQELVDLSTARTLSDFKLIQLSWVYDLTFAESFRIVAEREYVREIALSLPEEKGIRTAVAVVQGFVEERMGGEISSVPSH
ncbi:MAG TPA: HD domain-containing protein [Geobacteraceae bacterium]|nr:HD domain-containing protein [Geobacteraceae bacterium]